VNFAQLSSRCDLLDAVAFSIREAIAVVAGEGVNHKDVHLVGLTSGSLIVDYAVAPPAGANSSEVQRRLGSTGAVAEWVARRVRAVPGIEAAVTGPITVGDVAAPVVASLSPALSLVQAFIFLVGAVCCCAGCMLLFLYHRPRLSALRDDSRIAEAAYIKGYDLDADLTKEEAEPGVWRLGRIVDTRRPYASLSNGVYDVDIDSCYSGQAPLAQLAHGGGTGGRQAATHLGLVGRGGSNNLAARRPPTEETSWRP